MWILRSFIFAGCECQAFLYVILVHSSFPSPGGLLRCILTYSAEYQRGPSDLLKSSNLFSFLLFSTLSWYPWTLSSFSTQGAPWTLIGFPLLCIVAYIHSSNRLGPSGLVLFVYHLTEITLVFPDGQYHTSRCFTYTCPSFGCLSRRINPVPITPTCLEAEGIGTLNTPMVILICSQIKNRCCKTPAKIWLQWTSVEILP